MSISTFKDFKKFRMQYCNFSVKRYNVVCSVIYIYCTSVYLIIFYVSVNCKYLVSVLGDKIPDAYICNSTFLFTVFECYQQGEYKQQFTVPPPDDVERTLNRDYKPRE